MVKDGTVPKLVFVGTYPPFRDGIATYTKDSRDACQLLTGPNLKCQVAAINIESTGSFMYPNEVVWEISQQSPEDYKKVAREINKDKSVLGVFIQHEYGIYGGTWGEYVLDFINQCKKSIVTCMHTVLPEPDKKMKQVTADIIKGSDAVVVLSDLSKTILNNLYKDSVGKTYRIPHGIHPLILESSDVMKQKLKLGNSKILSTFGLLSRDKGIGYVIQALPEVRKKYPDIKYLILGKTHPLIVKHHGEEYRNELYKMVKELDLKENVKFFDKYFDVEELLQFLQASDIFVATSLNKDQAVSGTLSYALGAGRVVVSTPFTQSLEMIDERVGKIVPMRDSKAYADAIIELLKDETRLRDMHKNAYRKTRSMLWSNVGHNYLNIFYDINKSFRSHDPLHPQIDLTYIKHLTDNFAMHQFAELTNPDSEFGYTLDDNARAMIVVSKVYDEKPKNVLAKKLLYKYLDFIEFTQKRDGWFYNYVSKNKKFTKQNKEENLEDAFGRTMWALSEVMLNKKISESKKRKANQIWNKSFTNFNKVSHLRTKSFLLKALCLKSNSKFGKQKEKKLADQLARELVKEFKSSASKKWEWFEDTLHYANGTIPESLFMAADLSGNEVYGEIAKRSLDFVINKTFVGEVYVPIGNRGWYRKGKRRSVFDQQPEDPAAMIFALRAGFNYTKDEKYKFLAEKCFSWFLGNNLRGMSLYNHHNGGTFDGLMKEEVNQNQGAESSVSYLLARLTVDDLF